MKKVLAALLAMALCLSVCACGAEPEEGMQSTGSAQTAPAEESKDSGKISFDDLVLAEDAYVKIVLVEFFETEINMADGVHLEKCIALKIENKTDRNLVFMLNACIHNESVTPMILRSSNSVGAGQIGDVYYFFDRGTSPNLVPLDTLEELYGLELSFDCYFGDGPDMQKHQISCTVEAAMNGEPGGAGSACTGWTQFREYLLEQGPVTIVTVQTETTHNQVTIEATADSIRIFYEGRSTAVSGDVTANGHSTVSFCLLPDVKTVDAQMDYRMEAYDSHGNRQIQHCPSEYTWDIQNYHSGDEYSYTADYTHVDQNGNSIKKEGTVMTISPTGSFLHITDALSQTLTESGLGVTMADLGFTSY